MTSTIVGQVSIGALAFLVIAAAILDMRSYTIPNWLAASVLLGFAASLFGSYSGLSVLGLHIAAALMMLLVGFLLFSLNVFGGGDAKLIAAIALWTSFAALPRFLLVMSISGGLLALIILLRRCLLIHTSEALDRRLPYGVAIAIAGLDFCWQQINLGN